MKRIGKVFWALIITVIGLLLIGRVEKTEAASIKEQLSVLTKKQKESLK